MDAPATTADSIPVARIRVVPLALATALLTWLGDVLFWDAPLGINVGIFALLTAVGVLAVRPWKDVRAGDWLALLLLLGAAVQSGIDLCFTNGCVLVTLLLVFAGSTYFTGFAPAWRRWLRQAVAVLTCVERLPWLSAVSLLQRPAGGTVSPGGNLTRLAMILAPALLLVGVFAAIFAGGNVVFNELLTRFGKGALNWMAALEWSQWRLLFWLVTASVVLALLRPRGATSGGALRPMGLWQRGDVRLARMQSLSVLVALNGLFALVNTIDVVDLWFRNALPAGIDPKAFLHAGVNNLIVATVLAAMVLAAIFQQTPEVTRSRALRGLGYLWILQNLLLAASVFRRDYLYVLESHLLTEKRVYVLCFLGLVIVGYAFLAVHVQRGGRLARLLWQNAIAAFVLFYAMQFLNVSGFVSGWCARKFVADEQWGFQVQYWKTQGPAAWPALMQAANAPTQHPSRKEAREFIEDLRVHEREAAPRDWRGWQWLEARNRAELLGDAGGR